MSPTTVAYLTSSHCSFPAKHHPHHLYSVSSSPEMGAIRLEAHNHHHQYNKPVGHKSLVDTNNNSKDDDDEEEDSQLSILKGNTGTRTKENALKLIILSLSIVFYILTWNNNHVLQAQSTSAEMMMVYDHNDGLCCNPNFTTIPTKSPSLPSSLSSQNVVQLLMKKNALISFLMILIIVSVLCEKLFSHQIPIITVDAKHSDYHPINNHENPEMEIKYTIDERLLVRNDLLITIVCLLPWRLISKLWGYINQIPLPIIMRRPIYVCYANMFGCNLNEMQNKDLRHYRNLGEFFRRPLASRFRPICPKNGIVSPADGLVVQLATVPKDGGFIGSVKGINYRIDHFLGDNRFNDSFQQNWSVNVDKIRPGNRLYTTVVYLAPGDYHRFHSPTDWTIKHRRHFSGNLLSVKPSFVSKIPDLFAINERVVYFGEWKYGFFSMAAVGATNVGTINVFFDKDLQTNQTLTTRNYCWDKRFDSEVAINKGDLFGEFNLGSTMVMIYEAPVGRVHLETSVGQKVKYGELLLRIDQ